LDCCASGETAGGGRVRLQIGAEEPEVPAIAPPMPELPADPEFPVPPDATPDVPALKSGLVALARSLKWIGWVRLGTKWSGFSILEFWGLEFWGLTVIQS